jgi:hypothetical protein
MNGALVNQSCIIDSLPTLVNGHYVIPKVLHLIPKFPYGNAYK